MTQNQLLALKSGDEVKIIPSYLHIYGVTASVLEHRRAYKTMLGGGVPVDVEASVLCEGDHGLRIFLFPREIEKVE